MAGGIKAFGQQMAKTNVSSLLKNPSLNALPSPDKPATMPANDSIRHYEQILHSLYQLKKSETDPDALTKIEDFLQFVNERHSELFLKEDELANITSDAPPPPPPPPPAPAPAPGAMPPPGGPSAPGGPPPGAPPAAPPGGNPLTALLSGLGGGAPPQ